MKLADDLDPTSDYRRGMPSPHFETEPSATPKEANVQPRQRFLTGISLDQQKEQKKDFTV